MPTKAFDATPDASLGRSNERASRLRSSDREQDTGNRDEHIPPGPASISALGRENYNAVSACLRKKAAFSLLLPHSLSSSWWGQSHYFNILFSRQKHPVPLKSSSEFS